MTIFIGSDHAGFTLKQELKKYLDTLGIKCEDAGNIVFDPTDDYPDFSYAVARKVRKTRGARGILICDSGVGVCMAANKVSGIRAVNAYNIKIAEKSREHNNSNILCLGQDYMSSRQAEKIVKAWLETKFSAATRHHRRVDKIEPRV
ncbi:RpiB/LacA/LacB family sugar-phosphate isomerase [Patescibacteria group bacterium AH-259-L07]|nr:RpiB/LacA/LacB family sugar-phosphate isomerase [Patescibacteria group bacterium AH-259-L07]